MEDLIAWRCSALKACQVALRQVTARTFGADALQNMSTEIVRWDCKVAKIFCMESATTSESFPCHAGHLSYSLDFIDGWPVEGCCVGPPSWWLHNIPKCQLWEENETS